MPLLNSVVSAVEGRLESDAAESGETDDPSQPETPRTALFQCPDCESVYVAVDKRNCESCETAVEQVPATLSRTQ